MRLILLIFAIVCLNFPAYAQRHDAWTQLLSKYVVQSEDGINRVNYAEWHSSEDDRDALDAYIEEVSKAFLPTAETKDERFADWANLYNALTIRLILNEYPVSSIKHVGGGLLPTGPWRKKVITVNGRVLSLDDIEHKILRLKWHDPRVHYAVNCAALGCPNLRPKAWEAQTLSLDLDNAARDFISHPRGVTILEDGSLKVSKIYKWFREDFGGSQVGIVQHILDYATPDLKSHLAAETMITSYAYDWSLNDAAQLTK